MYDLKILSYIGLGSGAAVGFLVSCGNNFNSMSSGDFDWVAVAKAPIGSTCSRRWCAIDCWNPGSEWRLHRVWFEHSAMGDLLAEDFSIAAKDTLYRCLDALVEHKAELFEFLHQRWAALFGVKFDLLVYDLTST